MYLTSVFCRFSPFWFFVESISYAISVFIGSSTPTLLILDYLKTR